VRPESSSGYHAKEVSKLSQAGAFRIGTVVEIPEKIYLSEK